MFVGLDVPYNHGYPGGRNAEIARRLRTGECDPLMASCAGANTLDWILRGEEPTMRSYRTCHARAQYSSLIAAAALSLAGVGHRSAWAQPGADALAATASSEWGAGYGAEAAADGIANENGNYWQTVAKKDRGAWWQADLGQVVPVRGIQVAWACYEDKYHAPPARVIVQLSNTGADGPWKDVLTIEADKIPADEAPFEPERSWDYPLPEAVPGRFVRLFFPDGDQPQAKYDGYICLGEVQVDAPGLAPQLVSIEGAFGKVEVNVTRPSWTRLYLRGAGELGRESLLAVAGRRPWARGACTYVVAEDGKRYESRLAKPEKVEVVPEGGRNVLQLTGVKLVSGTDEPPVATEDWTLSAPGDGAELVWKITRRWQRDFTAVCSGSPGLFFSFDARHRKNSTTSTLWYDPLRIAAGESTLYALVPMPGRISENHLQTIRDRDAWAIYKLWTNWNAPADLRLEVQGGHLYRRGSYALLSEAGAVTGLGRAQSHRAGEVEEITLKIGAAEKQDTGYQLALTLPDKETEAALRDFYGSVFNGGAVNDQKGFDFGNETDGWYYAGSCWMYGATLAAGTPAAGPLSAHPYDAAQAFREHLAHVLSTLDEQGRAHFGYNQGGEWVDDNLHTILGTRFYLLHSGDLAFRSPVPARPGTDARLLRPAPRSARAVQARRRRRPLVLRRHHHQRRQRLLQRLLLQGGLRPGRDGTRGRARPAGPRVSTNWPRRSKRPSTACSGRKTLPAGRAISTGSTPRETKSAISATCASGRRLPWASLRPSRPARSWPPPTRGSRSWKRSTATRAMPGCRPCGPCRSISTRTPGRRSGDT